MSGAFIFLCCLAFFALGYIAGRRGSAVFAFVLLGCLSPAIAQDTAAALADRATFPVEQVPIVFDLKEGTETPVKFDDDTVHPPMAAWSPDGTKLLVYRRVVDGVKNEKPKVVGNVGFLPKNKQEVTVREPDGSRPKAVLDAYTFGPWVDWR